MDEKAFNFVIQSFKQEFSSRDYLFEANDYDSYFTAKGKRDQRKKYFVLNIGIKSLRKFDTIENTSILGETLTKASKAMLVSEKEHEDVAFSECYYDGSGLLTVKFCSVVDIAIKTLTSQTKPFATERW